MIPKDHLGDGVYAQDDGHGIVLTTEDGYRATNIIILEPEVLVALHRYMERVKQERQLLRATKSPMEDTALEG